MVWRTPLGPRRGLGARESSRQVSELAGLRIDGRWMQARIPGRQKRALGRPRSRSCEINAQSVTSGGTGGSRGAYARCNDVKGIFAPKLRYAHTRGERERCNSVRR